MPPELLTSLRLRQTLRPSLRRRLRPSGPLALPPTGRPFLATLLLLLPLAGPHPAPQAGGPPVLAPGGASEALGRSPKAAISSAPPELMARASIGLRVTGTYTLTPERRALLNTIRYAEGTWLGGSDEGYRVLYGGGRFTGFGRHPEREVRRRYVSAAAGAYQFLPTTWKATARELELPDFGPTSQDQAALHLVRKRGALESFDREGLSVAVLARLAPEWASLPSWHGGSVYGQPVHSAESLQAFYRRDLQRQRLLRPA